ncbi:helix-turn-helix domain-containing protein [Neoroseomonas oryzicola]|uniref:Helix-turn-helix domain-containing protein n=1 Tax=Neoroseomonas oryzicola TaxID=535904 RepID=A0A9X9WG47_9PROT|nr:helix-turn-helix domain-containing protein [Neoroseomonas oryzicola]MBR0659307.1 helix-turn-helix domain-containing protein [Neoroseomonas oryzicola]NKE15559.1 helix-turn-helix domain-containing protein [Neoroseomonas oryzicola]
MNEVSARLPRPGADAARLSTAGAEQRGAALRPVVVSTAALPPERQFDAWRSLSVPYLDGVKVHERAAPGFPATGTALGFGPFMFYGATLPAYDYGRTAARIRRDSLDHWIIAVCRRGLHRQSGCGADVEFRPGIPYVLSMARPFEAERRGEEIEWLSLFVARDAVPELEPALSAALYRPIETPFGRILADFLATLGREATALTAADLSRLVETTRSLLGAAVTSVTTEDGQGATLLEPLHLARVRRIIRENLGAATLGPARLCALAGISRSALYRLFEPLGGVASAIQQERLALAHRLLSDPEERRGIAQIAEAAGFFDPSTFSRAFRREFGIAPRDLRAEALAGIAPLPRSVRRGDGADRGCLVDLLRAL